jgi:hypothetical protein
MKVKAGIVRSSLLIGLFLLCSGCATMVRGTSQEVKMTSVPEGATAK